MSTSKLMKVTYYDPKSQIRLLCYADTVVWDTKPTPTLTALRFGGYPERVQGLADAIYGGATIEIEDGKDTYSLKTLTRQYRRELSHDGVYAEATLIAEDDGQSAKQNAGDKDEPDKDKNDEDDDQIQQDLLPRNTYIFCTPGERRELFDAVDQKTAVPMIPEYQDYVLTELQKRNNMRTYFRSLSDVLGSPLAQTAQTFSPRHAGGHRVLKSTKLEDAAYRDLRRGDNELDALEKAYGEKLSTFPALSRDIYQSFYSLNVRRQPEDAISEQARRFNAPILNEVMDGEDYPAIKAACEGRQLPAYEAASEFISQVAGNLDELLEKASGKKGALNTLERLEQKRDRSMEELQKLMKQIAQAGPEQLPELEKQAVKAANQAQSQVNQTEAVGHMVRDQMLQNKEAVSGCFAQAVRAAAQKAESVSSALLAWGYGPDSNDPERRAADLELAARVGKSPTLMEVARYLGRLKELMDGKRKNGYAYGRGEKYSLELGGDINRAIASEFAMLAAPETLPLFLRKLQRKALKQYQRREPICKGSGDIICMLDESSSAESQAPWCKAVALALLDIAMRDQRRFAVIHFAGVGDVQTDLFLPGQYDREDVLRCAETFLNGNTDYETPLREALRLMEQEGFENADMVFVTDGECVLPDSFLEKLKAEQSARGFQITGILLDQEDAGFEFSLRESCTNVYRTSQLSRDQIAEQLVVSRVA